MFEFHDPSGLFGSFEVNADPFWPKVSKLLGASLVLHLILLAGIVYIPPVRDALSIAMIFSGGSIVDRPYTKTQIESEGDITEITTEKFHYPEGYFMMDQMPLPTPTPTPAFAAAPPITPEPVPQFDPTLPLPTPTASPSPLVAANATPTPTPDADKQKAIEENEKELDRLAAETGMKRPKEINTRPFKDLLANAKKMKDEGKINLTGQIELIAEADRDADGKLKNVKVTGRGDKTLEAVALDFISALSDSGVLDFLEGTTHLRLTAKLDGNNVEVIASTEAESLGSAQKMERHIGGLIVGGRGLAYLKDKKDEQVYFNHTHVTRQEKEVSLKFAMPRAELGAMLSKHTAEK